MREGTLAAVSVTSLLAFLQGCAQTNATNASNGADNNNDNLENGDCVPGSCSFTIPAGLSASPTLCTSLIQGRCDCAQLRPNPDPTLETYTWLSSGVQRCVTLSVPSAASAGSPVPMLLQVQCYSQDQLPGNFPSVDVSRFGIAEGYLSSPYYGGSWVWGNDGVINNSTHRC